VINIEEEIIKETLKTPLAECCGVVIIDKYIKNFPIFKLLPFTNLSTYSNNEFEMDIDRFTLINKTKRIYAIYHSHVAKNSTEAFSDVDIILSENYKIPIMVYCPMTDKFNWYKPFSLKFNYIDRSFLAGVRDCYSLFRDYYYNELGITIPDIYRSYTFKKNYNISEEIKNFGFKQITDEKIKKNDVIIVDKPSIYGEYTVLIYLDNDKILSHANDISQIEYYKKYMKYNKTIIRYSK
jgi:proteasome lid subunit RPN8/RPN11